MITTKILSKISSDFAKLNKLQTNNINWVINLENIRIKQRPGDDYVITIIFL